MARITFTIPDDKVDIITEAYCTKFGYPGYDPTMEPLDTKPPSKAEFVKRCLLKQIRQVVLEYRRMQERATMEASLLAETEDIE